VITLERWLLASAGGVLALFLMVPMLALVLHTTPMNIQAAWASDVLRAAMRLSLMTTLVSTVLVVLLGTPLAWVLVHQPTRASSWLSTLLQVPVVMPPAVAGIALLFAFGHRGLLPTSIVFSMGAVIMAEVFVAAPLYLQHMQSAFRQVNSNVVLVARSLGATPWMLFTRIAIPMALRGLVAAAAMAWARALGEFGATLMFAGNMQGRTQSMPLAIYTMLETDVPAAQAASVLMMMMALVVLVAVHKLQRAPA
jgi:molybdate transport system permease protein